MLLRKDVHTGFRLNIKGYQFPHLKNWDDGNWLNVNIRVKHPKGTWEKNDPCLETFELQSLIEWLEKIADGDKVGNRLYFIEPCLEFELLENEREKKLRVVFQYEFAPPWIKRYEESFFLDFAVTETVLRRAAADLRSELNKFPVRGKETDE